MMFPDASETSDFESTRPTGSKSVRSPYFLQSFSNLQKDDDKAGLSRFQYYSKLKNFIKREDTLQVSFLKKQQLFFFSLDLFRRFRITSCRVPCLFLTSLDQINRPVNKAVSSQCKLINTIDSSKSFTVNVDILILIVGLKTHVVEITLCDTKRTLIKIR